MKLIAAAIAGGLAVFGLLARPRPSSHLSDFQVSGYSSPVTFRVIRAAISDADRLPCVPLFDIEPPVPEDANFSGSAGMNCDIHLTPRDFQVDNLLNGWAIYTVRHEVAHLETMGTEHNPHGLKFRLALGQLLAKVQMREVYLQPTDQYPYQLWWKGRCVLMDGCPRSSSL